MYEITVQEDGGRRVKFDSFNKRWREFNDDAITAYREYNPVPYKWVDDVIFEK